LPELNQAPGDLEIVKKRYSAFFGTFLDAVLKSEGVTRCVIAGVNTHACVRMTAIDAYQRDYDVVIASDCVDSWDAEHHEVTLRYLEGKIARLMTNDELRSH
jgi:nicotinamidase-related amidase